MTAVHGTFNRVTVAVGADNGQYLTLGDLRAFIDEADLEGIPAQTPFALQHDQSGRWVVIQAVHESVWQDGIPRMPLVEEKDPAQDAGGLTLPGDPPDDEPGDPL